LGSRLPVLPQRWSAGQEVAVQAATQEVPVIEQHPSLVVTQILPVPQSPSTVHR